MNQYNYPFWLLTIATFLIVVVSFAIQDGMFMDGLYYSIVARNLAIGLGTFWEPHLTDTVGNPFMVHPPLVYGIQSLFFRLFGDSYLVERGYSVMTGMFTVGIILLIWREITEEKSFFRRWNWVPIIIWLSIPVVAWTYSMNMLENTLTVFTTLSVYALLRGRIHREKEWLYIVMGGCLVFMGMLSKGFPALFPIAFPLLYVLVFKPLEWRKGIMQSFGMMLIPVGLMAILVQYPPAKEGINAYLDVQVIASLKGELEVKRHSYLLERLFLELLPICLAIGLVVGIVKRKKCAVDFSQMNHRWIILMVLVGVSASFPILLSPKQHNFYLVPSFPFYVLAIGLWAAPYFQSLFPESFFSSRKFNFFSKIAIGICVIASIYSLSRIGKTKRDREIIQQIHIVAGIVGEGGIVSACPKPMDHRLNGYFYRYHYISIDRTDPEKPFFFWETACGDSSRLSDKYEMIRQLGNYNLYKKRD